MPKIARKLLDHEYAWLRLLGIGLLLRIGLLVCMADEPLVSDALYYHQAAINLVEQGQIDTYWPPGLPLYEAVVVWIFGKGEIWVRIAMLFWFTILSRNLYHILYRLHSRLAANLGLLLLVLYPDLIHQSVEPLSYLPAAALLLSIFGQMQAYVDERRTRNLWRMGILIGLLILFRPSAALFLIALPPLILVRRKKLIPGFMIVLGAALAIGPWIYFASQQEGSLVFINTSNSRNLYLGNNAWTPQYKTWRFGSRWAGDPEVPAEFKQAIERLDRLPAVERWRAEVQEARREAREHPSRTAFRTASRMRTLVAFDTFAGSRLTWAHHPMAKSGYAVLGLEAVFWLLVGIGFLAFYWSEARRELSGGTIAIIAGFLLIYALPYWISFSHPTYHLTMVPLLLIPVAIWLERRVSHRHWPRWRKGQGWKAWLCIFLFLAIQVEWVIQMLFISDAP